MKHEVTAEKYIRYYGKGIMYIVDTSRARCASQCLNDYMLPYGHILFAHAKDKLGVFCLYKHHGFISRY